MEGVVNEYISDQSKGFIFDWRTKDHLSLYEDKGCLYCENVYCTYFVECRSCNIAFPQCELMFGYRKLYLHDNTCDFSYKNWYTNVRPNYVFCKECYPVFLDSVKK